MSQIPPQKPYFWGMNRHFKPNAPNIQTFILLKLLHHNNQILHSDKDHQVAFALVEIRPKQIQYGRRLPS